MLLSGERSCICNTGTFLDGIIVTIKGIAMQFASGTDTVYIVEEAYKGEFNSDYSCMCITKHCLTSLKA